MAYKWTSETFTIRARVTQAVVNGFSENQINLNLDSLSREILVVQRADMDLAYPEAIPGLYSAVTMSLANSTQTATINIDDPDCITAANAVIVGGIADGVGFQEQMPETVNAADDPLYIVATDNLFLGIDSLNQTTAKSGYVLLHVRRARADAGTYSAILTSQFN